MKLSTNPINYHYVLDFTTPLRYRKNLTARYFTKQDELKQVLNNSENRRVIIKFTCVHSMSHKILPIKQREINDVIGYASHLLTKKVNNRKNE